MNYFVTAIGTDSGKTVVSAILVEALQADYWKPIQSGTIDRDTTTIKALITNSHSIIHDEAYLLSAPMSPHAAAEIDNVKIDLNHLELPQTNGNHLVIEGAGGVLVPVNKENVVIDVAKKFDAQVVLVSNHYLGSINHTLLTVEELKRRGIAIKGIIFNGAEHPSTEKIILDKTGLKFLLRIVPESEISPSVIMKYAIKLFENWDE